MDLAGNVISVGDSFVRNNKGSIDALVRRESTGPILGPDEARKGMINFLGLPSDENSAKVKSFGGSAETKFSGFVKPIEPREVWMATADDQLSRTWRIEADTNDNWIVGFMDAYTAEKVHCLVDYTSHAVFNVYPFGVKDPEQGKLQQIENPWNISASPETWLINGTRVKGEEGNNAVSFVNGQRAPKAGGTDGTFSAAFDLNARDPSQYSAASAVQLFYTCNKLHDLYVPMGFNAKAGNFEFNNTDTGAKGNQRGNSAGQGDRVILNTQDSTGMNNANFQSPPDGQSPRMNMFLWDRAPELRDGSFDASIVIHEFNHGGKLFLDEMNRKMAKTS